MSSLDWHLHRWAFLLLDTEIRCMRKAALGAFEVAPHGSSLSLLLGAGRQELQHKPYSVATSQEAGDPTLSRKNALVHDQSAV